MGIRKNARFLTASEREDFARACVLLKADIVNPAAPPLQQYSRWDELTAIHRMIQSAFAPGAPSVNFGHGGLGRYSFLSWHRFFLLQVELALQSHVPGVTIPYWDWTDPVSIMTDDFLGPDGTVGDEVRSGYFAADAPGTVGGTNPTPAPAWWPASLTGWRLPDFAGFGTFDGPLRRNLSGVASLPTVTDIREVLDMPTYSQFQNGLESGTGITSFPFQQLHNGLHGWIGGAMNNPTASPFDPIFYLHHCNIDRLWAMWQLDGHATEYPIAGGAAHHHRNDLMYPWHGGAAGYGTNATIAADIPMPNFAALGGQTNADTLDFRALGYTYDCLPIVGLGLDRTGSMVQLTPDPMINAAPDVTKWEAATRGVSMFLQDCETVYQSGLSYVTAGVKTFRRLAGNDFVNVLPAPGYGLVKSGGTHGRAAFDGAVAPMTPGGSTPLADALADVHATLVQAPFATLPAGERRYLAMLTDGKRTSGAPMNSIADGSLADTAVFGMGFGTGADVDYATIASLVAKGSESLSTTQVFHGENAGTIDKFYSDSLAAAMGFTTVIDPVVELFAGEHTHIDFHATSAEDALFITVQGMDFDANNWRYALHRPDGHTVYGDAGHDHGGGGCAHHCCPIHVTARTGRGRLTLVVSRNHADDACWVGTWRLMVCYRTRDIGAMVMPVLGELLAPVQAGPPRGARYARLLLAPKARVAVRNVHTKAAHALDERVAGTQRDDEPACQVLVNIYARTQLRLTLLPKSVVTARGEKIALTVHGDVLHGSVTLGRSYARMIAPAHDIAAIVAALKDSDIPRDARLDGEVKFDTGKVLAVLERKNRKLAQVRDRLLRVVRHGDGPLHLHVDETDVAGGYHVGMYVEGLYCPDHGTASGGGHHHGAAAQTPVTGLPPGCHAGCRPQTFSRILTTSVAVTAPAPRRAAARKVAGGSRTAASKATRSAKRTLSRRRR